MEQSVSFRCSGSPEASAGFIVTAGIVFCLSKLTATCCGNLTCFVDYVQTLSCVLRTDLGASSYSLTATWYVSRG